jgi:hypothetical protein
MGFEVLTAINVKITIFVTSQNAVTTNLVPSIDIRFSLSVYPLQFPEVLHKNRISLC